MNWYDRQRRNRIKARRQKQRLSQKAQKAGAIGALPAIVSEFESHSRRRGVVAMLRSETPRIRRTQEAAPAAE